MHNKVLLFDRCTGLTLELAKIEKGAVFPEHYHTTVQTQFLVSGRVRLKTGTILEPGAFKYFASVPVYILPDGATFIYREDGKTIDAGNLKFIGKVKDQNFISYPQHNK